MSKSKNDFFWKALLTLFSGLLSIILLNLIIEYFPYWFSENLVQYFTITAKRRYGKQLALTAENAEKSASSSILTHSIRRFKPGTIIKGEENIEFVADEKCYRNPMGYYSEIPKVDIALFGDSFVYGSESKRTIADFLRRELPEKTVYSFGMPADGPPQWIKHYQFGGGKEKSPKVLILNFYEGNDLEDLCLYISLRDLKGNVDAYTYYSSLDGRYKKHNHIYNKLFGNIEGL